MALTVHTIEDRAQWDTYLSRHRYGHLLQSYEYGELHRYLGSHVYRLGVMENGQLCGTMLLTGTSIPLPAFGRRFTWLYCPRGPAVDRPSSPVLAALITQAHDIARHERAVVLRLEPNITSDDATMPAWMAAYRTLGFHTTPVSVHLRRSWVLDIRPDVASLLAGFKPTWRQNVRTAMRKGVAVRAAHGDADFAAYYHLLRETSRRRGFFIHESAYHREILRRFGERGEAILLLAEHAGRLVAARMLLRFGAWCWEMFGASSEGEPHLKAGYLLEYHCLRWAQAHGCSYYDFRGIPERLAPGEALWGVYQFKRGFGGFARLHMPTQDYVYHPAIYHAWQTLVRVRRARRHKHRARSS